MRGKYLLKVATVHAALKLLDDIATSDAMMGWTDIERLCDARQLLASIVGLVYDNDTERYTKRIPSVTKGRKR